MNIEEEKNILEVTDANFGMEKLPYHCQENAYFFKQQDYMNLEMKTDGVRTSFKFNKVPDIYTIDEREYFAVKRRQLSFE